MHKFRQESRQRTGRGERVALFPDPQSLQGKYAVPAVFLCPVKCFVGISDDIHNTSIGMFHCNVDRAN